MKKIIKFKLFLIIFFCTIGTYAQQSSSDTKTEAVNFEDYGGKFSIGIALGGGGVIGIPFRYYTNRKLSIELGTYFRPCLVNVSGNVHGLMLAGGVNIFLNEFYVSHKKKIKLDGLSIKCGHSFTALDETFFSFGWARERFVKDRTKESFILELGMGLLHTYEIKSSYFFGTYVSNSRIISPIIYFKFHWSTFLI